MEWKHRVAWKSNELSKVTSLTKLYLSTVLTVERERQRKILITLQTFSISSDHVPLVHHKQTHCYSQHITVYMHAYPVLYSKGLHWLREQTKAKKHLLLDPMSVPSPHPVPLHPPPTHTALRMETPQTPQKVEAALSSMSCLQTTLTPPHEQKVKGSLGVGRTDTHTRARFLPKRPDLLVRPWHPHTARCSSPDPAHHRG